MIKIFFTYVLVIAATYAAQTLFKISNTRKEGTFDYKILKDGIIDHLIYFAGILVFFFAGLLIPNVKIAVINGTEYTVVSALTLLAYYLMVKQAVLCLNNIKEKYEIQRVEKIEETQTTFELPNEFEDSDEGQG